MPGDMVRAENFLIGAMGSLLLARPVTCVKGQGQAAVSWTRAVAVTCPLALGGGSNCALKLKFQKLILPQDWDFTSCRPPFWWVCQGKSKIFQGTIWATNRTTPEFPKPDNSGVLWEKRRGGLSECVCIATMKTALTMLCAFLALATAHQGGECRGRGLAFGAPPRSTPADMLKDTVRDVKHTLETSKSPMRDLSRKYDKPLRSGAAGGVVGFVVARTARNSVMGAVKIGVLGAGVYLLAADMGYIGRDFALEEDVKGKVNRATEFLATGIDLNKDGKVDAEDGKALLRMFDRAQAAAAKSGSTATGVGVTAGALLGVLI